MEVSAQAESKLAPLCLSIPVTLGEHRDHLSCASGPPLGRSAWAHGRPRPQGPGQGCSGLSWQGQVRGQPGAVVHGTQGGSGPPPARLDSTGRHSMMQSLHLKHMLGFESNPGEREGESAS